jgi:hypothetical protein
MKKILCDSSVEFRHKGVMICLVVLVLTLVHSAQSLDASWIPVDGDGPLPLKESYRTALRQLCVRIKGGSKLPPAIETQRSSIEKQCAKLAKSDASFGLSEIDLSWKTLLSFDLATVDMAVLVKYIVGATALGISVWYIRHPKGLRLGKSSDGPRYGGSGGSGGGGSGRGIGLGSGGGGDGLSQEELREARLAHLLNNPSKGLN